MRALIVLLIAFLSFATWVDTLEHPGRFRWLHKRSISSMRNLINADQTFQSYYNSYRNGWKAAEEEIIRGKIGWLSTAVASRLDLLNRGMYVDYDSGLPVDLQGGGCTISYTWVETIRGHNERIQTYLSIFGLPVYSRKQWVPFINNPESYFTEKSKAEKCNVIFSEKQAITTPDGRFSLWLEEDSYFKNSILLVKNESGQKDEYRFEHHMDCLCFHWGPTGSDLLSMSIKDRFKRDSTVYKAFDLGTGKVIGIGKVISWMDIY